MSSCKTPTKLVRISVAAWLPCITILLCKILNISNFVFSLHLDERDFVLQFVNNQLLVAQAQIKKQLEKYIEGDGNLRWETWFSLVSISMCGFMKMLTFLKVKGIKILLLITLTFQENLSFIQFSMSHA